jgi:hypothetical protein
MLASRLSTTDLRLFRSGVQAATNVNATTFTPLNLPFYLWALNANGTPSIRMGFRGSFYSIGSAMTALQAATYYQFVQALQTALSRNV